MKRIFFSCLFVFSMQNILGQTITITDKENGEPLEKVVLMSHSPQAYTVTNALGQADISTFRDATHIQIRCLGYETVYISFDSIQKEGFQITLSYSNLLLEEVVISSNRWNELSNQDPSDIISIASKEARLQNPQTAADLLGVSGKVFVQKSQQGGGSPMIRGFATNRLLYSIDGVRMNTAIFRGGNLQNVISLDPLVIESTEVVFGPGSVIYGSDAIGGVMSFNTLTPQLSFEEKPIISGKGFMRYATVNGEKTGHFDVNLGWKKWAFLTSISANDFGDLKMGSYGPEEYLRPFYVQRIDSMDVIMSNDDPKIQRPSGYSQMNFMQKIRFVPDKNWDIQYGLHFSETSDYSRYDRHIRYKNGLPRYGEWKYGPQKWQMHHLNVAYKHSHILFDRVTLRLASQQFEESRISRDLNRPIREIRTEKVLANSINLDFVKDIYARNELYYGLEMVRDHVLSVGDDEDIETGIRQPGPARYPNSLWASYGIYVTDKYKFSDQFLIQGGLRYNYFQLNARFDTTFYPFPYTRAELSNGSLTGSLGLVYQPQENWVFRLKGATAFRAPNVDDMGKVFDSEPGAVTIPNPNLRSEYAYSLDAGVAGILNEKFKINVSVYYTLLKNAFVRRDFQLNGEDSIYYVGELSRVQAIQNAARAKVFGIQAGFEWKLYKGLRLTSDINWQRGEEELEDGLTSPSRHAAPCFGNSRLIYDAYKLQLQFYANYSGARKYEDMPEEEKTKTEIYAMDQNGKPWSPSWYTLNFKANYKFAPLFFIGAGLENITDRRYRPYSSGIVAPGRNFILSLQVKF